jgi:23S rRNA (cytidine2498-2'-O)-methyltransferase
MAVKSWCPVLGNLHPRLQGAIDLGAAPGAWTELLAKRARRVVAVDPANLSEQCAGLKNVRHIRKSSVDAGDSIVQALGEHKVDVIVCDMNQPPRFCADCISPLLPLLVPGGWIVMTCKMYGMGRDRYVPFATVL